MKKRQIGMFEIKCPECKANIKGLLRDYLKWRSDRRKCPHCGVQLHISNVIFCFGLCGLIFGVVIGSLYYLVFDRKWIRLLIAIALLICWIVLPIIVRTTGRWQASSIEQTGSSKIKKWTRFIPVSLLALAIAFTITYFVVHIIFLALDK